MKSYLQPDFGAQKLKNPAANFNGRLVTISEKKIFSFSFSKISEIQLNNFL